MGRGRPRYDDVLTPREWEVLDLLKRGLSNAEIADRLGVTRDTAKFHVSEIITKLGVESREQAAAFSRKPRFKFGWAPTFGMLERVGAAAAGAVVVVAALLILWKDPDEPSTLLPPGIYVLDPASGDIAPRVALDGDTVWSFDWTLDGRSFETMGPVGGEFIRRATFDAVSGALLNETDETREDAESQLRWLSPDGQTEAVLTDGGIEMHDVTSYALLHRIDKDVWGEISVAWAPDSNWLALMTGPYDPQKPAELRVVSRQPGVTAHTVSPAVRPADYSNGQNWMDWAPDSRSLAFVRDGMVWSLDVTSGQETRLAAVTYAVLTEPRWSPDGRELAFRSADTASLYVANADGSEVRYVAPGGIASISPDGKRIATRSGGHLWTLRADGSDPEVIGSFVPTYVEVMTDFFPSGYCGMQFPLAGDGAPRWSQDGKHVLITDGGDPPTVYIVERDGNHDAVQVGVGYSAGWSPNGEHITFVRECKVHVVPFDGADTGDDGVTIDGYRYDWRDDGNLLVRQSSLGPGTVPETMAIYDPSGQRLASYPEALLSPNGDLIATLETIVLETGAREWTTTIRATASGQVLRTLEHVNHVTFSPNARWIAYEAGPCCQMTMWVLDLSNPGSSPVLVAAGRGSRGRVWSPDSNKLAFTHRITEGSSNDILAVFDLESGSTHTIAEDATAPQWFPDSERLLFVTNFR